jgi:hypothetical protein
MIRRVWLLFLLVMTVSTAHAVGAPASDSAGPPPAVHREGDIVSAASLSLPQKAKITGSDPANDGLFGTTVALDGDTALAGDPFARNGTVASAGATSVFVRSGAAWIQQARLAASDPTFAAEFGYSIAISGDRAIVGAPQAAGPSASTEGAAYIFTRTGTTWTFDAKLTAFDGIANHQFGHSVTIDGTTAVVGAPYDNGGAGALYVFTLIADIWVRGPKLTAIDSANNAFLGASVVLKGSTVISGANAASALTAGDVGGAAYVFTRVASTWTQQAKLIASDATNSDLFGNSVAFDPGSDTAVVGSPCNASTTCYGGAYIYTRSGTVWTQRTKLTASDRVGHDYFGLSVAISDQLVLVGTPLGPSDTGPGRAYLFQGAGAFWSEVAILQPGDGHQSDWVGQSVAITGATALVGAPEIGQRGAAYVFANTAPVLPVIDPKTTPEDVPLTIPFTVSDAESAPDTLTFITQSSNPALVPDAGLAIGGTGSTRTLTITPAANRSGDTMIGLSASDGFFTITTFFRVTVTPVNDLPTMSTLVDQTIMHDTSTAAIPLTIGDVETPVDRLVVSAISANSTLVPPGGIVLGGSGATRTITLTPAPHEHGTARITVIVDDGTIALRQDFILTVQPSPTYYLAEGATGAFFDTDLLLANPNDAPAPITITFFKEDGSTIVQDRTLAPLSRTTMQVDVIPGLEATSFSTQVISTANLPLAVERTMRWDASGYGASGEKATDGAASTWYFAEGSQGFFSTYFLLVNPGAAASVAHVTYFREGEPAIVRDYPLLPASRFTIDAGAEPDLANRSFGAQIVFDQPGVAERAMYFGTNPFWSGGHDSAGVTAPSRTWFLAEGATGSFFNTFVLLVNPGANDAHATLTYFTPSGPPITRVHAIAAGLRLTINLADEDPSLASAAISTQVQSSRPILVERSQYWPQPAWYEGHNSFGVTDLGTHWGLAEGRVGGAAGYQTYILLANPGTMAADVTVRLLRTSGAPIVKTFTVAPATRFNVAITGPGSDAPELIDEAFGAVIESTQPIAVERAMYSNANGVIWAAGTNATATRLP